MGRDGHRLPFEPEIGGNRWQRLLADREEVRLHRSSLEMQAATKRRRSPVHSIDEVLAGLDIDAEGLEQAFLHSDGGLLAFDAAVVDADPTAGDKIMSAG